MEKNNKFLQTRACTHTLTLTNTCSFYDGGVRGGSPSSLGVAVSSLGSRLSFRLTVLSEGGGVNSVGGGVSGEDPSWVPLVVAGGAGSCVGVAAARDGGVKRDSGCGGAGLERRPSVRGSEVFSTKRHCMMLMSFPPVEIRWLSLYRKLTLVTWLLWALYLWLGACKHKHTHTQMHVDLWRPTRQSKTELCVSPWPWRTGRQTGELYRNRQQERWPFCCEIWSEHWCRFHQNPLATRLKHTPVSSHL